MAALLPALLPPLAAAAVTALAAFALRSLSARIGLRDRTPHGLGVPRVGGLAVVGGLAAAALLDPGLREPAFAFPVLGAAAIGLHDDLTDSSPALRLVLVAALAALAAFLAPTLPNHLFGVLLPSPLAALGAAAFLLAVTVGFDFIDGLDGLATGLALIAALSAFALTGSPLALTLAAALSAFLLGFNRPAATAYLGDCGSNALGMATGLLVLRAAPAEDLALACLLVAVPLLELGTTVLRRARARALFAREHIHLHHRLRDLWGSATRATGELLLVASVGAAAALLADQGHPGRGLVAAALALALLTYRARPPAPGPRAT